MNTPTAEQAQARINEIQALYREWLRLKPKLDAAQAEWRQAAAVIQKLTAFYEQEYGELYQTIEDGLPVSLHTEGEYSVMSEDALWDALGEQYDLAWGWMRAAMKVLDRNGEQSETEAVDN